MHSFVWFFLGMGLLLCSVRTWQNVSRIPCRSSQLVAINRVPRLPAIPDAADIQHQRLYPSAA